MSVTIAKCSVGQAESYFENELTSNKVNYYTEQDKQVGDWTGEAAEKLGVSGKIEKTDFVKLVKGENPVTGEQMRRRIQPKPQFANGEWRTAREIGTHDAVVSAPKSVSIAALIGGDERVIEAHREAVNAAVKILESEVRANLGAGKTQKTGNAVIAQFHHDTARPDWKNGLVAPQLHTHCVIMNITQTGGGKWKPIDSREMYRSQTLAKSVYYSKLAENLQNLGYAIEIDEKTNAPEISAISKEYREACSPRRTEILEQAGGDTANKQHREAGRFNRRGKVIDRETVKEQHREIEASFDNEAAKAVEKSKQNKPITTDKLPAEQLTEAKEVNAKELNAKEAVSFALEKLSEREAVFDRREVLKEANKRGIAFTTVEAIEQEFESRQAAKQVETVAVGDGKQVVYLSADARREKQLPQLIEALKPEKSLSEELQEILNTPANKGEPDKARSASAQEKINNSQKDWTELSDEQRKAVTQIATAPAGVVTLEGRAGVGKTTTLKFVSNVAEAANYEVLGLAPTTGATAELEAAGIKAATLQKILQGGEKRSGDERKRFFIVDESGFVSSRQMDKFLREAVKSSDRVLFVGDTRQHEAVEAGRPFAQIQENKVTSSAKIETIRRQRKESDRETVKKLSQGQIVEAIEEMRERGQVKEIKDVSARHAAIVQDFVKEPEKTLVIAPRNTDRQRINRQIHEELKHNRQIGDENKTIKVLEARNELSGAERKVAGKYVAGDIIQYSRGSRERGITGGSQTKVIKIDCENNLLTVETAAGKTATYDPKRLSGVSVFKEEEIEVCAGERLRARAAINPGKGRGAAKIANGEMLTIERIKGDKIHLLTQTGKAFLIDAKEAVALDYGYAATSHSAQGKTIDKVLIHADTGESEKLLNERMAYIAVSRARDEIKIYTDDAAKLPNKLARKTQKTEIADVLQNFEQQKAEETTVPPDVKAENMPVKTVFSGKTEILKGRANGDSNEPLFANLTDDLPAPDARKPTPAIASENPNQTADAQPEQKTAVKPEQKTAEQQPAQQPEADQPTAKLSNSDYAVLNAQIIVCQAELADLKFDETLLHRDTEIKRFDVFSEPVEGGENISTAAAAKTIDRIEFLRLRSTNEPLAPPPGDEANRAKWSMTDVNAAREVLTDTRDFIKAEKNSRDENKWHNEQNLKNLFENHLDPLKMAENHLNMLTPGGLANQLKVQANPLSLIKNHPVVQIVISLREMKNAAEQAALLGRIETELTRKLYRLNTHITNEVVDRITDARESGRSAVSQKQNEIDELKELTKNAPEAVKPDFTAEELEKISVSAIRVGDHNLMYEYQKAAVDNARRIESDRTRFGKEYNETYKTSGVDKFSARKMRELENTPVTESQAEALVEQGGKHPKNMLDALHQIAEIKGEDYVKRLAEAHRASGKADFPQIETFDNIDVLAHAQGQKVVADLRAAELENEFERRFAADKVNDSFSEWRAEAATVVENAKRMADYLGKISADFRVSLIKEGMNPNVAPVVSQAEAELVKFDELKEKVGVYDKPQMTTGVETAPVKTAEIQHGAADAAGQQHHEADAAKRELQERAASASRTRAVEAESVDNSIGIDM